MSRFSSGFGLSALAHGALVAYLGHASSRPSAVPALSPTVPVAPAVALATPAPDSVVELTLLELPPEPVAVAPRRPAPPAAPAAAAIATRRGTDPVSRGEPAAAAPPSPASSGPAPAPGAPERPSALGMRRFEPPRLVVPDLERLAAAGAPAPAPAAPSGELAPAGHGEHRSDQGPFVARVGRDGQVTLDDKPNVSASFALPSPRALGKGLARWYADPYAQTRDPERQPLPSGVVDDAEEQRKRPRAVPIVTVRFDVTDWIMRMAGRDPYLAAKLRFLDRTRAERVELAAEFRKELLRNVTVIVRGHLARVWADAGDPSDKRRLLFELWDECLEQGEPEEIEAAGQARAAIVAFVRDRLPSGSAHAYGADELAELNRGRTSRQPFAPYDE